MGGSGGEKQVTHNDVRNLASLPPPLHELKCDVAYDIHTQNMYT